LFYNIQSRFGSAAKKPDGKCKKKKDDIYMLKRIALILTLILITGAITSCNKAMQDANGAENIVIKEPTEDDEQVGNVKTTPPATTAAVPTSSPTDFPDFVPPEGEWSAVFNYPPETKRKLVSIVNEEYITEERNGSYIDSAPLVGSSFDGIVEIHYSPNGMSEGTVFILTAGGFEIKTVEEILDELNDSENKEPKSARERLEELGVSSDIINEILEYDPSSGEPPPMIGELTEEDIKLMETIQSGEIPNDPYDRIDDEIKDRLKAVADEYAEYVRAFTGKDLPEETPHILWKAAQGYEATTIDAGTEEEPYYFNVYYMNGKFYLDVG
jgi:hypothetical protein